MCSIGKSWLFSILISHIKRNKFTNIAQDTHIFDQKEQSEPKKALETPTLELFARLDMVRDLREEC